MKLKAKCSFPSLHHSGKVRVTAGYIEKKLKMEKRYSAEEVANTIMNGGDDDDGDEALLVVIPSLRQLRTNLLKSLLVPPKLNWKKKPITYLVRLYRQECHQECS